MILSQNITQLDITAALTYPKPQTEAKKKQKAPIPKASEYFLTSSDFSITL